MEQYKFVAGRQKYLSRRITQYTNQKENSIGNLPKSSSITAYNKIFNCLCVIVMHNYLNRPYYQTKVIVALFHVISVSADALWGCRDSSRGI
jgi:hypothetical protein